MTSVESHEPTIPPGIAMLGDLVGVPVDQALLSGRRPIVAPDVPAEGYGAATWHAFASLLVDRVAELEAENDALRAGAMHPTARDLLEMFLLKVDRRVDSPTVPVSASGGVDPFVDPAEAPEPAQGPAEPDGLPVDEVVAAVAGATPGVGFWDEAAGHGLLGRVRRSVVRRRKAKAASSTDPSTDQPTDQPAVESVAKAA